MNKVKSIVLHLIIFFTPLLFVSNTNELYEFPKTIYLYFAGTALILISAIIALKKKKIVFPDVLPTLFVIIYAISTLFSSHLYTSVWGYFTRFNGGLISVIILFGIYLSIKNSDESNNMEGYVKTALLTLIPIGALGIFQHFTGIVRVYSTLGQPNWLAAYLSMLIPIVLHFALINSKSKIYWSFIYLISFSCLWFTYSLSGILGFLVSLAVLVSLNIKQIKKQLKYLGLMAFLSLLIGVLNLGVFSQRIEDIYIDVAKLTSTLFRAYATGSNNLSDPGFIRIGLWKGTLDLATSSPKVFIIGTGPETFPYAFQKFRPVSLNFSSEWDFIFNKPHNYYLEMFSQIGSVGLVVYLLIFFKIFRQKNGYLVPGLSAFFVTNIFGWPTAAASLLFWVFLAFLFKGRSEKNIFLDKGLSWILILTLIVLCFFSFKKFSSVYFADVYSVRSEQNLNENNGVLALKYANKAVGLNGLEPLYLRRRAKVYIVLSALGDPEYKMLALKDLEKAYQLNPTNLATIRNSVPLYYFLAMKDLNRTYEKENIDPQFLPSAVKYFEQTSSVSPNDVGIYVLLAKYQNRLGIKQELEKSVARIKILRPDLLEWHESLRDINVGF